MRVKIFSLLCAGIIAAAVVVAGIGPASAIVKVKTRVKYYDIYGNSGIALAKSMIKRGPKASGLQHAIASTAPDMKFGNAKVVQVGGRCKIADVDIRVTLVYTYPRWRNQKRASPQLRRAWRSLYKELVRHEETHGKIVIQTAQKIYREFRRESGRVSKGCKDFGKRMERSMPRIIRTYERRQIAFDRREALGISRVNRLQRRLLSVR